MLISHMYYDLSALLNSQSIYSKQILLYRIYIRDIFFRLYVGVLYEAQRNCI